MTLMPVELVNETLYNISGEVYEFIDSSTLATMFAGINSKIGSGSGITADVVAAKPTSGMTIGKYYAVTADSKIYKASSATAAAQATDLVTGETFLDGGDITKLYNILTGATATFAAATYNPFIELGTSGAYWFDAIKDGFKLLKKGDMSNGIAMFEPTAILARPDAVMDLLGDSGILQTASNYAQTMIAQGTLSPDASYMQYGVGTKGMILSVPVVEVPDYVFTLAKSWLSGADNESDFIDQVQALVLSDIATVRGIADEYMNVLQSTEVNATNLLPLYQWGVETLYGTGIAVIVSNGSDATLEGSPKVIGWDTV